MTDTVTPFRLDVGDEQLDDLRRRLARARWPEPAPVPDWSQGVPVDWLRDLCSYWQDGYDWRRCEKTLTGFPQFTTESTVSASTSSTGVAVTGRAAVGHDPRLARVGGGVLRCDRTARGPRLVRRRSVRRVHVVCPSLPGYGFSDRPAEPGWDIRRIADTWAALMALLGYDRYGAQGGDWGGFVSSTSANATPPTSSASTSTWRSSGRIPTPSASTPSSSSARWPISGRCSSGVPGTPFSRGPDRRPSATGSSTRRSVRPRRSPRSTGRGPTTTGTRQAR